MSAQHLETKFSSWKAIARYFGCSERTVRRWEVEEGLPVHRHKHRTGARIYAFQSELDAWLSGRNQNKLIAKPISPKSLRIAIIPFSFFSDGDELQFLRDAICEDMVTDFASLNTITVISYSSMRFLPKAGIELQGAIRSMELDFYIEGNIRAEDSAIKLNVRLVNGVDQSVEWNGNFNAPQNHLQSLRKEMVSAILTSLPIAHSQKILGNITANSLSDHTAWEYLHRARTESMKWQPDSIQRAIELLEAARKLAGDDNVVLANLGRTYLQLREAGIDCSQQPIDSVTRILEQLQRMHPNAYYTQVLSGWFHYVLGDLPSAIVALSKALKCQPHDPDALALISNCYLITGQPDLALPHIRLAQLVDPLTPLTRCLPGWYNVINGSFYDAIAPYEQMLKMEPNNPLARMFLVWIYALCNKIEAVKTTCEGFLPQMNDLLPAKIALSIQAGLTEEPFNLKLTESQHNTAVTNEMFARFLAFAYAQRSDVQQATFWLGKAHDLGFCAYPFLRDHAPYFKTQLDYPPLRDLMLKIQKDWQRGKTP